MGSIFCFLFTERSLDILSDGAIGGVCCMTDEQLRQAILVYCEKHERSQAWLSRQCQFSRSLLNGFLLGKNGLSDEKKIKIISIISK
jgi:hypothetical protein